MKRRFGAIEIAIVAIALGFAGCATEHAKSVDETMDQGTKTGSEFEEGAVAKTTAEPKANISDLGVVYFDFDKSAIRPDEAEVLRKNAGIIKGNPSWGQITLEGNTDERGSEEYNLALGERRAMSVKRYLVDLGVDEKRLRTVSFGEAKPAVPGHDETAWRYNRRVDFAK